jgi:hypothetical protein
LGEKRASPTLFRPVANYVLPPLFSTVFFLFSISGLAYILVSSLAWGEGEEDEKEEDLQKLANEPNRSPPPLPAQDVESQVGDAASPADSVARSIQKC